MKGMLKAELFKFSHSYSLWIIIGVLVGFCGISIMTGTYDSAESTLASLSKDSMVPILACAVYSAIVLTDDFSNGLLRQYISNGYTKSSIICAKFVHYILGCTLLLLIYPLLSVFIATVMQGVETSFIAVIRTMFFIFIKSLPLYWGICGLFFLFSILIKKGVFAMGVSIASSILIVVFTNKLYESAAVILKYSPIIQINLVSQNITDAYFISIMVSLVVLISCLCGSIVKFCHDEL